MRDRKNICGLFRCAFMVLVFVLSVWTIAAAEQTPTYIGDVVVTATKSERTAAEVPGRIETITSRRIEQMGAQTIDDVLNTIAGINVNRTSGIFSLGSNVTLRGLSNEQSRTLVLLDGIPINKTDTGGVNWNRINIEDVEKIEVFKGPASSLYGKGAMGGVINIITKKPAEEFAGEAILRYGSFDLYGGTISLSGRSEMPPYGFYWGLSGLYNDSPGYFSTPEEDRDEFTTKRFFEEAGLNLKLGYDFDRQTSLEFAYDYYDDKRGEGVKYFADDGVHRHFDTDFYRLRYKGGTDNIAWDANIFYQIENYTRVSERLRGGTYTRFDVESDREDMGILFNMSKPMGDSRILAAGLDITEGRVDAADIYRTSDDLVLNRGKMRFYGLYLQDEAELLDGRMKTLLGLRYDYSDFFDGFYDSSIEDFSGFNGEIDEKSWSALSPRLSGRYFFNENISSYLSYGRAFRSSILDDLCRPGIMWGIYKEANPDVKPETIDTFELGFDYNSGKGFKLDSTVFYSLGKDFLYYVDTGREHEGRPLYRRENVAEVEIYGLELSSRYDFTDALSLLANYTFNHSEIKDFPGREDLIGEELTRTPRHQARAGFEWLNPSVNMSVYGLWKDSQLVYTNQMAQTTTEIDGYFTANLKFWRTIADGWNISLNVDNVFDERYLESEDDMAPGRFIWAELSYKF